MAKKTGNANKLSNLALLFMSKQEQLELVITLAKALTKAGNKAAASCFFTVAAAMAVGYEEVLADKLVEHVKHVLESKI